MSLETMKYLGTSNPPLLIWIIKDTSVVTQFELSKPIIKFWKYARIFRGYEPICIKYVNLLSGCHGAWSQNPWIKIYCGFGLFMSITMELAWNLLLDLWFSHQNLKQCNYKLENWRTLPVNKQICITSLVWTMVDELWELHIESLPEQRTVLYRSKSHVQKHSSYWLIVSNVLKQNLLTNCSHKW